jgi:hypothetical protein
VTERRSTRERAAAPVARPDDDRRTAVENERLRQENERLREQVAEQAKRMPIWNGNWRCGSRIRRRHRSRPHRMASPADSARGDGVRRVDGNAVGNLDILVIAGRWFRRSA